MSYIQISAPPNPQVKGWRPFGLGFRPFFLLAGLSAVVLIVLWLSSWHGATSHAAQYYGHIHWHSHEMLFGFATAVIAGFLLTAVRNWTGRRTPDGLPLALLTLLWLLGRVLPWLTASPAALNALIDLAFLPALAAVLSPALWQGANRTNRLFVPLLLAMAFANALVHAQALGWSTASADRGIALMLDLVLLLLIFVGGRVMPFFTEKAIAGARPKRRPAIEAAGVGAVLLLAALHLAGLSGWPVALVLLVAGATQALRLAGWYDRRVWSIPILWVLYTGYAWLAVGLSLVGLSEMGWFAHSPAVHALTMGTLGVFTLGMMARVALGHTGRVMRSATSVNLAFVLANLAAGVRVFGPAFLPTWYVSWVLLAGALWVAAFAIFAWVYTPILLRPRADGRPD